MTRILVLGREGQLGSELIRAFADVQSAITATNRSELDIADAGALHSALRDLRPAIVINAAAYTSVDDAQRNAEYAYAINRDAPALIAAEIKAWNGVLIHYSTDYVFDGRHTTPYVETAEPAPINVYGASKLAGERALAQAAGAYVILRTSWLYGSQGNNFCKTVWQFAHTREDLQMVDDQIGSPTAAASVARATRELIERYGTRLTFAREIFHVSAGGAASRHAWAKTILALLQQKYPADADLKKRVVAVSSAAYHTPAARPAYSALSSAKIKAVLGIELPEWRQDLAAFISTAPDSTWN